MELRATQVFHEDSFSQSEIEFREPPAVKQVGSLEIDGNSYKVMTGMNKIGRHPKCKIVINHETVSKEHAEIEAYEGEGSTFIRDLKSSNKTKINNVTLKTDRSYQLNDGATLTFGRVHAVYRICVCQNEGVLQNVLTPIADGNKNLSVKKEVNASKDEGKVAKESESRENRKKAPPVLRNSKRAMKKTIPEEVSPPKRARKSSESIEAYLKPKPEKNSESQEIEMILGRSTSTKSQEFDGGRSSTRAKRNETSAEKIFSSIEPKMNKQISIGRNLRNPRKTEAESTSSSSQNSCSATISPETGIVEAKTSAEKISSLIEPEMNKRISIGRNLRNPRKTEAESTSSSSQNSCSATISPETGIVEAKTSAEKISSSIKPEMNKRISIGRNLRYPRKTEAESTPSSSQNSSSGTMSPALEENVPKKKGRGRKPLKSAAPAKSEIGSELESNSNSNSILERSVRSSTRNLSSSNLDASSLENSLDVPKVKRSYKRKNTSEGESQESNNSSIGEESKTRQQPKRSRVASSLSLENLSVDSNSSLKVGKGARTPVRSRKSLPCPDRQAVLFTGVNSDEYQAQLDKIGAFETEDPKKSTILVTDKIRRTYKFLCALCMGIPIVSVEWLVESGRTQSLQNWENFVLKDPAAEAKFGFKLKNSLEKARNRKVLDGYTVVITPNVTIPPIAELKQIIAAAGGKALLRPTANWGTENVVILSKENDLANARKFMAKAPATATIQDVEFLLTGIIRQELNLDKFKLQ